jgi:hypothetical protein
MGPKMLALRDDRERKFCIAMALTGGNAAKSARMAGYSDHLSRGRITGHSLRHRERIIEAMAEVSVGMMKSLAIPVVAALGNLVMKPDHKHHAKALQLLMPHVGFHDRLSVDVNMSGTVNVNHTDAALEDLRRLKMLGVPRETLEKTFGFSGLDRYEKLLAASENAKLIEGRTEP